MSQLETRLLEFRKYIWNHSADAFQMQFDERRDLTSAESSKLAKLGLLALEHPDEAAKWLQIEAKKDSSFLALTLQICGLTRNKVLQDLKASASSSVTKSKVPGSYDRLPFGEIWAAAGPYIIDRFRKVMRSFAGSDSDTISAAVEALNQATWPGYIRQERAKRSGHEAEYRLATLFQKCGLPFHPEQKAENPLCPDAQVRGVSFDLVCPNIENPSILVKSTVHTANIGQYGESKDHLEISEALSVVQAAFGVKRPIILAFIDGVGFYSNSAGLNGVLMKSDEFCQFRTIWKAIVVAMSTQGLRGELILPRDQIQEFQPFLEKWQFSKRTFAREEFEIDGTEVEAGEGFIKVG